MRYRGSLTIPAGQTESDPAWAVMGVCAGIITEVEILFPSGHSGLTYLQIWHQERQIFPTTPGETFRGDDNVIQFGEQWPITEVPHRLMLRGWAPEATLNHTIFVEVSVRPFALSVEYTSGAAFLPEGFD